MTKNRHRRGNFRKAYATRNFLTSAKVLRPNVLARVLACICLGCAGVAAHEATAQTATPMFTTLAVLTDNDGPPSTSLVEGSNGSFYFIGATEHSRDLNAVFRVTRSGKIELVRVFKYEDGQELSGIIMARDGNLYGTFDYDARTTLNASGTVFKLTVSGKLTTLHLFAGGNEGSIPSTGLIQARDGNFYGTTKGGGKGTRDSERFSK